MSFRIFFLVGCMILTAGSSGMAQQSADDMFSKDRFGVSGQVRPSLTHIDSRNARGENNSLTQHQIRGRLAIRYRITDRVRLNTRAVIKLSTEMKSFDFWTHPYAPTSSGLDNGRATFDILNISWQVTDRLYVEAGRMQHAFQLRGLIPKSFDRYHSQNLASTWSNGLWARWSAFETWDLHAIVQYNHPKGNGSAFTPALINFQDDASRFSYFLALESTSTDGFWKQRGIGATFIPQSIQKNGERAGYFLFSGRLGVQLPVNISWMNMSAGTELSYAPNSPDLTAAGIKPPRSQGSLGWQASLNFEEIFDRNAFSILYGYSEPGMVLAPSYRNNIDTWEIRYQYRFTASISTEIRYRIRNQLFKPTGAETSRLDRDFYARLTINI